MYFIQADSAVKLNYDEQYRAIGGMNQENKQLFDKFFPNDQKLKTKMTQP